MLHLHLTHRINNYVTLVVLVLLTFSTPLPLLLGFFSQIVCTPVTLERRLLSTVRVHINNFGAL